MIYIYNIEEFRSYAVAKGVEFLTTSKKKDPKNNIENLKMKYNAFNKFPS